jgi:CheY-like chemotaxis protein
VKFTPKGGRIDVVLQRVNSHIEITVTDSAIGIASEFLPRVFERFRQADSSATRPHGGLGLGLAIVKQLVELHGGSVCAESAGEQRGATFVVSLPLGVVRQAEERAHPTSGRITAVRPVEISLDGLKVLVVDDEPDARELLRLVLIAARAEVITAGSASEGLALLSAERPDVLVSDIGMPERDGYHLVQAVRSLPADQGGKTPAIALTALARSEDRMRPLMAGPHRQTDRGPRAGRDHRQPDRPDRPRS